MDSRVTALAKGNTDTAACLRATPILIVPGLVGVFTGLKMQREYHCTIRWGGNGRCRCWGVEFQMDGPVPIKGMPFRLWLEAVAQEMCLDQRDDMVD